MDIQDPNDPTPDAPTAGADAGGAITPEEMAQARQWADAYVAQHQIPVGYGDARDLMNYYAQQRQAGVSHDAAMQQVPGMLGWDTYQAPPAAGAGATTGSGGSGSNGWGANSFTQPFGQQWQPPGQQAMPTLPGYAKPPAFSFKDFVAPTEAEAGNEAGYKFGLQQGEQALQNSAAARGILNTGMTLKDILDYGRNAATQQYGNVWNRSAQAYAMNRGNALDTYNVNYGTQYKDPYAAQLVGYQTDAAATQRANEFNTNTSLSKWWDDYQIYRNQQNDSWNKVFGVATA